MNAPPSPCSPPPRPRHRHRDERGTSGRSAVRHLCVLILTAALLAGCTASPDARDQGKRVLRIKGSDTMLLLAMRWGTAFMQRHPEVAVYVEGGGSGSGLHSLIDGDAELCTSSRPMRADEARALLQRQRSLGFSILTAKDGLSIYLHPENPIRNLSLAQLRALFLGEVRNWSELGGENVPVRVFGRPPNSGTHLFFEEHVLRGNATTHAAITVPTTAAVVERVRADRGAIGYGGLAYGSDVTHASIDGIAPTAENVRNGTYPIARYLYLYAARAPEGDRKAFIDFVLGAAGQTVVRDVGYIPLWETTEP